MRVGDAVDRQGQGYRACTEKELSRELIRDGNARVMYNAERLVTP